jgi:hypothetical protein
MSKVAGALLVAVVVAASALGASYKPQPQVAAFYQPPAPALFATVYEDCNFTKTAKFAELPVGEYKRMQDVGVSGGHVSSIKVPPGLKVTLYEFENFEGRHTVITSDAMCLTNTPLYSEPKKNERGAVVEDAHVAGAWNDKVYSIKVELNR